MLCQTLPHVRIRDEEALLAHGAEVSIPKKDLYGLGDSRLPRPMLNDPNLNVSSLVLEYCSSE